MKYLNILFCLMMLYFFGVRYNDPDGLGGPGRLPA